MIIIYTTGRGLPGSLDYTTVQDKYIKHLNGLPLFVSPWP